MLLAVFCLAFCSAALADQEGNSYWCNSDQYGCWVTGEDGGQSYIMFWSESARDFFMGPGSKACVAKPYPAGKMPLDPPPVSADPVNPELTTDQKVNAIVAYVLKNQPFYPRYEMKEEDCNDAVESVRREDGFDEAVNNVYNMISGGRDQEDIKQAILEFFGGGDLV